MRHALLFSIVLASCFAGVSVAADNELTDAEKQLIDDLYAIQALKFGEFKLKSGALSPFYVDLRVIISHPPILQAVARRILDLLAPLKFQRIAGIPYAGLPIATAVSLAGNLPMSYARKEAKDYGTKRVIEGRCEPGEIVVLIDDVITDGASKFEAAEPLIQAFMNGYYGAAGAKMREYLKFMEGSIAAVDANLSGMKCYARPYLTLPFLLTFTTSVSSNQ
jgi:orotate phosphoribosyltransferase